MNRQPSNHPGLWCLEGCLLYERSASTRPTRPIRDHRVPIAMPVGYAAKASETARRALRFRARCTVRA